MTAIIGILAVVVLPYVTEMTGQSSIVVARQQQAELQAALGSWVAANSSKPGGLAATRTAYTNSNNKLSLLSNYLQISTYNSLVANGANVSSGPLNAARAYLRFSSWPAAGQPTVEWINK